MQLEKNTTLLEVDETDGNGTFVLPRVVTDVTCPSHCNERGSCTNGRGKCVNEVLHSHFSKHYSTLNIKGMN